jgi:nucleoside-diphosphate-sugar epimerase
MAHRDSLHVVIGAGPAGRGVAEHLRSEGRPVRVVTRSGHGEVPEGAERVTADVGDPEAARRACADARVVFGCVGLPGYQGWEEKWPGIMTGLLAGAESAGARLVFSDNL